MSRFGLRALARQQLQRVKAGRDLLPLKRLLSGLVALQPDAASGDAVAVLVSPWLGTAVPWLSLTLGAALMARGGRVVFITLGDDAARAVGLDVQENALIRAVMRSALPHVRVLEATLGSGHARNAHKELAQTQIIWQTRAGSAPTPTDPDVLERAGVLAAIESGFLKVLEPSGCQAVLTPGGFYGVSGPFRLAAASVGQRVASFDSGPSAVLFSGRGVAAHNADVPGAMEKMLALDADSKKWVMDIARAEFQKRRAGNTIYQVAAATQSAVSPDGSVLIPLNVEWDAAALGRHRAFDSVQSWMQVTVGHILEHHPHTQVVIRRHPAERHRHLAARIPWAEVLEQQMRTGRVRMVEPQDPVSTYDLMSAALLVLPKASTAGVEAAAMGRQVVVEALSCYVDMPFVHAAANRQAYLALVDRALNEPTPPTAEQMEQAWLCYYLTQCCGFHTTVFNPHLESFRVWSLMSALELLSLPTVEDMLTSTLQNQPMHWLTHLRWVARGQA